MTALGVGIAYELLDCGDGRRLERFGSLVLDRPAPVAVAPALLEPAAWAGADGRFERSGDGGRWTWRKAAPEPWHVVVNGMTFELRPAAGGQVGLFAEQRPMWTWIADQIAGAAATTVSGPPDDSDRPPEVLNLFAFTGGSTLAAARAGAHVTHVDAARGAVAWARRNAELSDLADRPIRWLTDDVETFVRRELRRGRSYDGVILDPPSYGHGPRGRSWHLGGRLDVLLEALARLVSERNGFIIVTAHATDLGPQDLRASLLRVVERRCENGRLEIIARSGARLSLGAYARVARGPA